MISDGRLCGLNNDVLAALCLMSKDKENKLELKIDNVLFLSSQTILRPNQADYNVVFAVNVNGVWWVSCWDKFFKSSILFH